MINNIQIFDCSIREIGYQTGWHFDKDVLVDIYKFALGKGIDYVELGFFHDQAADPDRGYARYCSQCNSELQEIFGRVKNAPTKLSAMRDIQRPLSKLLPAKESVIDTVRILTRSKETDLDVLAPFVEESLSLGYETFLNFTSAGFNSIETNRSFAQFAKKMGVHGMEFADTESVMTPDYVKNTIQVCHDEGMPCGVHVHDKNGTAEQLADIAIAQGADYVDVTHLGLGGKWRDGNLTMEYLLRKLGVNGGYEATIIKNQIIEQLIKYHDKTAAV